MRAALARRRDGLARTHQSLTVLHPRTVLARERAELVRCSHRLSTAWTAAFERRRSELQRAGVRLDALSPLKVLARGYAIATRADGRAVRTASDVTAGDTLHVRVRDARIEARVVGVDPLAEPTGERTGAAE